MSRGYDSGATNNYGFGIEGDEEHHMEDVALSLSPSPKAHKKKKKKNKNKPSSPHSVEMG